MKVEGPSKSSGAKGVSKTGAKKSTGDSSFSGLIDDSEGIQAERPVSGVMNIGQIDALLSLQEAPDSTSEESAKKGRKRAEALLDQLDKVKMGLLTGGIPRASLQALTQIIGVHRDKFMDPKLADILDEIDLRAQVELAKLDR